ncbi:MAG TPA: VCBS repeat-containing protein [Symbiobacteriaceae bacterium]|nr:VCBS repeat-containing protein [Symbiobacteriaceae bacterium]
MKRYALLIAFLVLTAGCAARPQPQAPADPAPAVAPEPPPAPDPLPSLPPPAPEVKGLTPDRVQELIRTQVNTGAPLSALLGAQPYPDAIMQAEADLDGDGAAETVIAPQSSHPMDGPGAIYVIYRKGDRFEVDRSPDSPQPEMPLTGVRLHAVTDLTGDGRPEIIWSSSLLTAYSPPSAVSVSQWAPGKWTDLPGHIGMISMELAVDGRDLLLTGGGVGGGSSGLGQVGRTDRYLWVDGAFRLVDRVLRDQESGYSLVMQAISDEDLGKSERAIQTYRKALEPSRNAYDFYHTTRPAGNEVMRPRFEAAVRGFARFRLGLHLLGTPDLQPLLAGQDGLPQVLATATTRGEACTVAADWMRQHADFGEALNSLIGYVHPQWKPENICGALHEATNFVARP